MMINKILLLLIAVIIVHLVIVVAAIFFTARATRKLISRYQRDVYNAVYEIDPHTTMPVPSEELSKKKGSVWSPKKDPDYVMRGKVVDIYD